MAGSDKIRAPSQKTFLISIHYIDMPHLGESFVLKRRKSPNIPTLAFVNESVGKEISNSG